MADNSPSEKAPAEESFLSQPVSTSFISTCTLCNRSPADQFQNSDAQGQLTTAVDELLNQLQSKFDNVSKEVFGKCTSGLEDLTRLARHMRLCYVQR